MYRASKQRSCRNVHASIIFCGKLGLIMCFDVVALAKFTVCAWRRGWWGWRLRRTKNRENYLFIAFAFATDWGRTHKTERQHVRLVFTTTSNVCFLLVLCSIRWTSCVCGCVCCVRARAGSTGLQATKRVRVVCIQCMHMECGAKSFLMEAHRLLCSIW